MSSLSDWVAVTISPCCMRKRTTSAAVRLSFGSQLLGCRGALDDDDALRAPAPSWACRSGCRSAAVLRGCDDDGPCGAADGAAGPRDHHRDDRHRDAPPGPPPGGPPGPPPPPGPTEATAATATGTTGGTRPTRADGAATGDTGTTPGDRGRRGTPPPGARPQAGRRRDRLAGLGHRRTRRRRNRLAGARHGRARRGARLVGGRRRGRGCGRRRRWGAEGGAVGAAGAGATDAAGRRTSGSSGRRAGRGGGCSLPLEVTTRRGGAGAGAAREPVPERPRARGSAQAPRRRAPRARPGRPWAPRRQGWRPRRPAPRPRSRGEPRSRPPARGGRCGLLGRLLGASSWPPWRPSPAPRAARRGPGPHARPCGGHGRPGLRRRLEEWLLTPIPSASQRSRHSLLVSPSSSRARRHA